MTDCVSQMSVPVPQVSIEQFSTNIYHIAYYKCSHHELVNDPLPHVGKYIVYASLVRFSNLKFKM